MIIHISNLLHNTGVDNCLVWTCSSRDCHRSASLLSVIAWYPKYSFGRGVLRVGSHVRCTTGRGMLELFWFDVLVSCSNLGLGQVFIVRIIPFFRQTNDHSSRSDAARSAGQWKESQAGRTSGGQLGRVEATYCDCFLIFDKTSCE